MSDPFFSNVSLLLDGHSFTDTSSRARSVTQTGVSVSTAQSKFGGSSFLFAPGRVAVVGDVDLSLGTSDFTIDLNVYQTGAGAGYQQLFSYRPTSGTDPANMSVALNGGGISIYSGGFDIANTGSFPLNQWNNLRITRNAGLLSVWKDGAFVTSATVSRNWSAQNLWLGGTGDGAEPFSGHISQFRITKGVVRNTAAFTPATADFPAGAAQVSGVIRDSTGALCARTVRLFQRDTGALIGSTVSNATTGAYTISTPTTDEVARIVHSSTTTSPLENDLIDRVIPA